MGKNDPTYYKKLTLFIKKNNIDTNHFVNEAEKRLIVTKIGIETKLKNRNHEHFKNRLQKDTLITGKDLKRILILDFNMKEECSICHITDWQNKKLSLHTDHIDGDHFNNEISNLRFLCPNCHSQTETYAGKNIKYKKAEKIQKEPKIKITKRPSKEDLEALLFVIPTTKIGEKYGVTDKAVEKWAKFYGLEKPGRGYWAKEEAKNKENPPK